MIELTPEAFAAKLAGVAGALVSMNFIQGSWPTKLSLSAAGAAVSYYFAPFVVTRTGLPETVAGFLLGLFGMAIAEKFWRLIEGIQVSEVRDYLWTRITGQVKSKKEGE